MAKRDYFPIDSLVGDVIMLEKKKRKLFVIICIWPKSEIFVCTTILYITNTQIEVLITKSSRMAGKSVIRLTVQSWLANMALNLIYACLCSLQHYSCLFFEWFPCSKIVMFIPKWPSLDGHSTHIQSWYARWWLLKSLSVTFCIGNVCL